MVFVVYGHESQKYQALFDKLFRLRHQVLIVNRRWSLPCTGGTERDQYDTDEAVYFIDLDAHGEVLAHARLTPTLQSSLTADYFPHLIENGLAARGATIFEATRFMVLPTQRDRTSYRRVKASLLAAGTEWCLAHGVTHMQTVIDAGTLPAYLEVPRWSPHSASPIRSAAAKECRVAASASSSASPSTRPCSTRSRPSARSRLRAGCGNRRP